MKKFTIPVLMLIILSLGACVTPLGNSQVQYIITLLNSGESEEITEIITSPFLVDDLVIITPVDIVEYLDELIGAIGPLPLEPIQEVAIGEISAESNLEIDTFIETRLPKQRALYRLNSPEGEIFLLLGKGDEGIRLYGISGPRRRD